MRTPILQACVLVPGPASMTLTVRYSYHSNKALLMMKKYRIGRVQEPWINLEPPIRAAKPYEKAELDEKKDLKAPHDRRSRRSVDLSSVGPP